MNAVVPISEMQSLYPMIKIIELGTLYYLYDAKSNFLVEVTIEQIDAILKSDQIAHDLIPLYLKGLFDNNVFLPGPLKKITPNQKEIIDIVDSQLSGQLPRALIIEVTEKCNLKCRYCLFSQEDGFKKRKHSRNTMKESTAYCAIDYYYNNYISIIKQTTDKEKDLIIEQHPPVLQWWGGEPFEAFDLILKTKKYFDSLNWEQYNISKESMVFGLTSNLTIFNDDILLFLIENNIKLRVSLDGDKEEHNKNRVFSNDRGTFDIVMRNIETIIERYPGYARKNLGFQSVLAGNIDIGKAQQFINMQFRINTPSSKVVANAPSSQREKFCFLSETDFVNQDIEDVILSFKNKLDLLSNKDSIELMQLLQYNKGLYAEFKTVLSMGDTLAFNNPLGTDYVSWLFSCPLGIDTIMVSVNGNIHCCCKTDYSFSLGHVDTGIDIEKLRNVYLAYYSKIDRQCKNCWAFRFCNICPALTGWEGEFVLPNAIECKDIRKRILINLMKYIIMTTDYDYLCSQINTYSEKNFKPENDSKPINLKNDYL